MLGGYYKIIYSSAYSDIPRAQGLHCDHNSKNQLLKEKVQLIPNTFTSWVTHAKVINHHTVFLNYFSMHDLRN